VVQPARPAATKPAAKPAGPASASAKAPTPTPAANTKPEDPPAAPQVVRPPAPPGLSWDDADELVRKISRVQRRLRTGRAGADEPLQVTQRELNSFVNLSLAGNIPPGVTGVELQLLRDALGARALVDLDRVKGKLPSGGAASLLGLLSGTVPVELRGRLQAGNGVGRIEVQEASVGGVSLPPGMVAQMVSLSTRSATRPQGFDIFAPFPLPWTAREVRFEPGRMLVTFSQKP
jgi:hypothetical protein